MRWRRKPRKQKWGRKRRQTRNDCIFYRSNQSWSDLRTSPSFILKEQSLYWLRKQIIREREAEKDRERNKTSLVLWFTPSASNSQSRPKSEAGPPTPISPRLAESLLGSLLHRRHSNRKLHEKWNSQALIFTQAASSRRPCKSPSLPVRHSYLIHLSLLESHSPSSTLAL